MTLLAGIDIGGTKCAVSLGRVEGDRIVPIAKRRFPTPATPEEALAGFMNGLDELLAELGGDGAAEPLAAIGISCGGPLNSRTGLVLSPPNLPGWDHIDVVTPFRTRYGVPVGLQNDANACALAEWQWGAGQGCDHMLFLTFGTGMGAGLILNGRLYAGANDMAGEVGHIRLAPDGPIGYGKAGSFEGFCSGGGIAQLARSMAAETIAAGEPPSFCRTVTGLDAVTAQTVGEAARQGDPLALEVYGIVGRQLGSALAVFIDVLNPQRIVIGSIYGRQQELLEPLVIAELRREALAVSLEACTIVPSGLGEQVGDFAGLSVALYLLA